MKQALSDILPILLLVFSLLLFGIAMYNFSQRKMASELLPTSYVAPVETNK